MQSVGKTLQLSENFPQVSQTEKELLSPISQGQI